MAPSTTTPEPLRDTNNPVIPDRSSLELITENSVLKEEVVILHAKMQVVLNHSRESDRLLEFTNNVFLPPRSLTANAVSVSFPITPRKAEDLEKALEKIKSLKEDIMVLRCPFDTLKEESRNMIDRLICIEEENK